MFKPLAIAAVALACLASGAQAGPDAPAPVAADARKADAVMQLLHDKGLLPTAAEVGASPLVRQMRDAAADVRDKASDMVMSAMNFLGVRYRRGGNSAEQGFDCSGFTRYVFEHSLGLVLPRRADQQAKDSTLLAVKKEELKPGDLVFFNTMRRAFSHVGIYVGEGKFIHAPRAGGEVRIEDMRQAYWTKRFNGARRAELPETPPTMQPVSLTPQ
jgi:cell wall-associated NlpC family hydrolase